MQTQRLCRLPSMPQTPASNGRAQVLICALYVTNALSVVTAHRYTAAPSAYWVLKTSKIKGHIIYKVPNRCNSGNSICHGIYHRQTTPTGRKQVHGTCSCSCLQETTCHCSCNTISMVNTYIVAFLCQDRNATDGATDGELQCELYAILISNQQYMRSPC